MSFGSFVQPVSLKAVPFSTDREAQARMNGWPAIFNDAGETSGSSGDSLTFILGTQTAVDIQDCPMAAISYWDRSAALAGDPQVRPPPCKTVHATVAELKLRLASNQGGSNRWARLIKTLGEDARGRAQSLLKVATMGSTERAILYANPTNATSLAHFDTYDNRHTVLEGKKRFLLSPPGDYKLYRLHPFSHPHVRQAQVHFANPDERFKREVRVLSAEVAAGESLLIPAGWIHQVTSLTSSIAVSVVRDSPSYWKYSAWVSSEEGLLPFIPMQRWKGRWKQPRLGFMLLHFLTVFLAALAPVARNSTSQPQLGCCNGTELASHLTHSMFSAGIRAELGVIAKDARGIPRYPCERLAFGYEVTDSAARGSTKAEAEAEAAALALARRSAIEAARRFGDANDFNEAIRPLYVLPFVENLALLMGRKWGLAFLEDCVLQEQGRGESTRRRERRKGKQKRKRKKKRKKKEEEEARSRGAWQMEL